jgi:hypothetical protein
MVPIHFQECRGSSAGRQHYYIENIFEELDTPGEWYLDHDTSTLYVYPNKTGASKTDTSKTDTSTSSSTSPGTSSPLGDADDVVISGLETILRVNGGADGSPATGIQISGFEITETRSTFLEQYECPSGGDWVSSLCTSRLYQSP